MIQKLPQECFECDKVNKNNYKLFIVDNVVVFPDNILSVEDDALSNISVSIYFVYGTNVQTIGRCAFG